MLIEVILYLPDALRLLDRFGVYNMQAIDQRNLLITVRDASGEDKG